MYSQRVEREKIWEQSCKKKLDRIIEKCLTERKKEHNSDQGLCEWEEERKRDWLVLRTLTVGYVGGSVTVCHS